MNHQYTSPDDGQMNLISQWPGSNNSVKKQQLLIYKSGTSTDEKKNQTACPYSIALHTFKQEACSAEVGVQAPVFAIIKNNSVVSLGFFLNTVTVHKIFIPGREFILCTCHVGAVWHLTPCKISPS